MVRLFRVFIPTGTLILLISEAFLIAAAFIIAVFYFRHAETDNLTYLLYGGGRISIGVVLVTMLVGLYLHDLYSQIYVKSRIELAQQLCMVSGAAFLVQSSVSYLNSSLRMPIHVMVPGSIMAVGGIYCWRLFFNAYVGRVIGGDRLLLVGTSPLLNEIAAYVGRHPEKAVRIIGSINQRPEAELAGVKFLGPFDALREVVAATKPTRIIVGMSERRNCVPMADLLDLRFAGNIIEEVSSSFERVCGRVSLNELRPSQLIYSGDLGPRREVIYHSIFNIVVAGIGVVVSLPIMLITALAVRLSSPGPVLYRQVRVGRNGVPFTVYKFRSMAANAEAGTGAVWASKDDPRVTAVGRIIRKIRFDEFPQLFNVLKGEMSIVGPRPERPEFVQTLSEKIPYYRQRHCISPGITGWAQINYKYGDTLEDTVTKLEYDLYYIKNMSLTLDLYIIFHTLKAMLLSRGSQ
jgi:sugar transferase (PEP-CTERM system associated)